LGAAGSAGLDAAARRRPGTGCATKPPLLLLASKIWGPIPRRDPIPSGSSSAKIISASPACRCCTPRRQQPGPPPNAAGLNLVRDVLVGVLFTLWIAWRIWLLVLFCPATHRQLPLISRHDRRHATFPVGECAVLGFCGFMGPSQIAWLWGRGCSACQRAEKASGPSRSTAADRS
jgi:hypothetical protein